MTLLRNSVLPFIFIFLLGLPLVGLISCNSSKAFAKRATKLQVAGMYSEAAQSYFLALQKNHNNVDAKIGMKKTGQLVLNDKLNDFVKSKNFGEKKDAVYSYQKAESYYKKIQKTGVQLNFDSFYSEDYQTVKQEYMDDLYDEGALLLEDKQFAEAESVFKEISSLDPEFKDAELLQDIAYSEPLYQAALEHKNANEFRSAFEKLSLVVNRQNNYKDAAELKAECLHLGKFTMAILPFENATRHAGIDVKLGAYTLDALTSINDPFLKIVDRENLQLILDEQQLGLSGVINEETAVNVGELIGAHALISGTVLSFYTSSGQLSSKTVPAYEQYKVKKWNATDEKYYYETTYKKRSYKEYYNNNSATISFQFKVTSLETGEVILSKIVENEIQDNIRYATYRGDRNKLYPSHNDKPTSNRSLRNEMQSLFEARRELKSSHQLSAELYSAISNELKSYVETLLQEQIP